MPRPLLTMAVFSLFMLPFALRRWRDRRWFSRLPLVHHVQDLPVGTVVRIVGTIETEGKVFRAPGSARTVVYARTQLWEPGVKDRPGSTAREDIRGVPFRIRLADGVSVRLRPADIALLDPPQRLKNVPTEVRQALGSALNGTLFEKDPPFFETTLAPGDLVEAVGRLNHEVSVEGDQAPTRGIPLAHTLMPLPTQPIRLHRHGRLKKSSKRTVLVPPALPLIAAAVAHVAYVSTQPLRGRSRDLPTNRRYPTWASSAR